MDVQGCKGFAERADPRRHGMAERPQAFIRIVPRGGTKTPQQIVNQWEYLCRKGELELQLSARHLGIPLKHGSIPTKARSWAWETGNYIESEDDQDNQERDQDLTTHIIVSFPPGTDQDAAFAAGREWAHEMFGSGNGGGRYDYLTAFHTDREHPHLHVVVNRRELLGREWLKISRRHPHLNYKALRTKMVAISRRFGIEFEATSRADRGISEPPMTYARYRRLEREKRITSELLSQELHAPKANLEPSRSGEEAGLSPPHPQPARISKDQDSLPVADAPRPLSSSGSGSLQPATTERNPTRESDDRLSVRTETRRRSLRSGRTRYGDAQASRFSDPDGGTFDAERRKHDGKRIGAPGESRDVGHDRATSQTKGNQEGSAALHADTMRQTPPEQRHPRDRRPKGQSDRDTKSKRSRRERD